MPLYFHFEVIDEFQIDESQLTNWITKCVEDHEFILGEINYIFSDDEYVLDINKQYLSHDYYTDIITFDYTEDNVISGDLFISIDRVKDNAKEFSKPYFEELLRVLIHGILHLVGFDDKDPKNKIKMTEMENKYISLY